MVNLLAGRATIQGSLTSMEAGLESEAILFGLILASLARFCKWKHSSNLDINLLDALLVHQTASFVPLGRPDWQRGIHSLYHSLTDWEQCSFGGLSLSAPVVSLKLPGSEGCWRKEGRRNEWEGKEWRVNTIYTHLWLLTYLTR